MALSLRSIVIPAPSSGAVAARPTSSLVFRSFRAQSSLLRNSIPRPWLSQFTTRCLTKSTHHTSRTCPCDALRRNLHGASISSSASSFPSRWRQRRRFSSTKLAADSAPEAPDYLSEGELKIFNKLKEELQPEKLEVQDISGGCGSMYAMDIVSPKFSGLTVIKQHKLVNKVLEEEIKTWHGVQLKTKAP